MRETTNMSIRPERVTDYPAIRAAIYIRNSEVIGYTRIHTGEPTGPRIFLARDHEAARAMVATIVHTLKGNAPGTEYILPLHPFSASARAFGQAIATSSASPAGMACSLGLSPLADYFARVRANQHPPGRLIWPVAFDLS